MDIAEARDKVQSFAQGQGLTFTILLDESSSAAREYRVRGIPSSFLIDREGVIQVHHTGPLNEEFLDDYAERFLR